MQPSFIDFSGAKAADPVLLGQDLLRVPVPTAWHCNLRFATALPGVHSWTRWILVIALAVVAYSLLSCTAIAQDASGKWPAYSLPAAPKDFPRGSGWYLSEIKIIAFLIIFLLWVRTSDWVNQDCQELKLGYGIWNSILFGTFMAGILLVWTVPIFWLSYALLLLAYAIPLGVYVTQRNELVTDERKVMTARHWRHLVARTANKVGIKMAMEEQLAHELGPDVQLFAQGADDRTNNINLLTARQSPGYLPARELFEQAMQMRAEGVMLDYTAASVGVKFQIDGVWHNYQPLERAEGDAMLAVFKQLSNLNPQDRASKQFGRFRAEVAKKKFGCRIQTQGTKTGEAAVIVLDGEKKHLTKLDELGMRSKMQEQLNQLLSQKSGFIIVSAMPSGGLTTTFQALLESTDRFMRNFASIDDAAKPEPELMNVVSTSYDSRNGETPMNVLPGVMRTYPDCFVVRNLVNGETIDTLCDLVQDERMVFSTIRAKEAVEALLRVLALRPMSDKFAASITAVLNVRLIRKLCDNCKEAYAPPPELLKQLGLPPDRVPALYRPPVPPPPDSDEARNFKPCETCMRVGYYGRTAILELLTITDEIRKLLSQQPKLETLREIARRGGHRSLQDEGVLMVARGITSLPELMRVLKL